MAFIRTNIIWSCYNTYWDQWMDPAWVKRYLCLFFTLIVFMHHAQKAEPEERKLTLWETQLIQFFSTQVDNSSEIVRLTGEPVSFISQSQQEMSYLQSFHRTTPNVDSIQITYNQALDDSLDLKSFVDKQMSKQGMKTLRSLSKMLLLDFATPQRPMVSIICNCNFMTCIQLRQLVSEWFEYNRPQERRPIIQSYSLHNSQEHYQRYDNSFKGLQVRTTFLSKINSFKARSLNTYEKISIWLNPPLFEERCSTSNFSNFTANYEGNFLVHFRTESIASLDPNCFSVISEEDRIIRFSKHIDEFRWLLAQENSGRYAVRFNLTLLESNAKNIEQNAIEKQLYSTQKQRQQAVQSLKEQLVREKENMQLKLHKQSSKYQEQIDNQSQRTKHIESLLQSQQEKTNIFKQLNDNLQANLTETRERVDKVTRIAKDYQRQNQMKSKILNETTTKLKEAHNNQSNLMKRLDKQQIQNKNVYSNIASLQAQLADQERKLQEEISSLKSLIIKKDQQCQDQRPASPKKQTKKVSSSQNVVRGNHEGVKPFTL